MSKDKEILNHRFRELCAILVQEQNSEGFWDGKLSSSALSTAIAMVALKLAGNIEDDLKISSGYHWLKANVNDDGGFGDTPESQSNVSTSLICYAAVHYCQPGGQETPLLKAIEAYLASQNITLSPQTITSAILKFYGKDYTFSVPILSLLIICDVLPKEAASHIPQLPFELSLLPQRLYRFFNLQVVSYAIPALIGVGIFIHTTRKPKIGATKYLRSKFVDPAIRQLTTLMPESGGFLEAIPLTGFVSMCLMASGKGDNIVVKKGLGFLTRQQREDGSWPIDTNLSTWVTTLAVKALGPQLKSVLSTEKLSQLRNHLLSIQYKSKHPFNGAKAGGWGWTSFSGSVPDADDTPGAILALLELFEGSGEEAAAIVFGCYWLVDLQNSDGGFPTFCKGWGKLPFDSSCADLTGHTLLAFVSTLDKFGDQLPVSFQKEIQVSALKAAGYLQKHQASDGHWLPLWFGNQQTPGNKNPVYGTARVSVYLTDCLNKRFVKDDLKERLITMNLSAQHYLLSQQNEDGSWGGQKNIQGTIEETSLAISTLVAQHPEVCAAGFDWLRRETGKNFKSSPIGLYFAALWYDEKMYPIVCYTEALRRFLN
ncbi:MAG: prenyltransferase/squalene oxidase repeat-containing protein [Prolixibacteraceae bacterium]